MVLFNFLKRKEKTFSNEDIEKEYERVYRRVQSEEMSSFNRAIKQHAEKVYDPRKAQKGDDLLNQKNDFIRCYSFKARMNHCYYSSRYKKGKFNSYPLWTQKWHDYEQTARLEAQKVWRELLSHTR